MLVKVFNTLARRFALSGILIRRLSSKIRTEILRVLILQVFNSKKAVATWLMLAALASPGIGTLMHVLPFMTEWQHELIFIVWNMILPPLKTKSETMDCPLNWQNDWLMDYS